MLLYSIFTFSINVDVNEQVYRVGLNTAIVHCTVLWFECFYCSALQHCPKLTTKLVFSCAPNL